MADAELRHSGHPRLSGRPAERVAVLVPYAVAFVDEI